MKKILGFLLIVAVAVVIGAYLYLGEIVKMSVEKVVPMVTKTTAKLDHASVSLLDGHLSLKGLAIGNPQGFSDNPVFSFAEVTVDIDPKSLTEDTIVVKKVLVDKLTASYEIKGSSSNVGVIQNNVNSFARSASGKKAAEPKADAAKVATAKSSDASSKKVVIDDLLISNSELKVSVINKDLSVPLPEIHLTNVGKDGKNTVGEVFAVIMNAISVESIKTFSSSASGAIKDTIKDAKDALKAKADEVKSKANELKSQRGDLKKSADGFKSDAKELGNSLKGMFNKK